MGVTISTHNGSSVANGHNVRDPKIVSKEDHIDLDRPHEIWHDEKLADAYHRIFDDAVARYNDRQTRADRKIENYLADIKNDANRKPVYEMIIGVYGEECSEQMGYGILREFVDGWKERNPNLEMIGAYYHADEQGQAPHVHIDYIPVAHGYQRGMDTQNGLVKALEEQGIKGGKTMKETAQIKWEKRENEHLESLCVARGLTVEHPGKGKKHLDTPEYKALQDELQATQTELQETKEKLQDTQQKVEEGLQEVQKISGTVQERRADVAKLEADVDTLQLRAKTERTTINDLSDRKREARQEYLQAYSDLQKTKGELRDAKAELQEHRETVGELEAFIEGSIDAIGAYNEQIGELQATHDEVNESLDQKQQELQEARQELQEAHESHETVKSEVDSLRAEKTALEASVSDLEAKKEGLTDELTVLQRAVKRESDFGRQHFTMAEWNSRIAESQKDLDKDKKIKALEAKVGLYEQFMQSVPGLWQRLQAWLAERLRGKEKDKKRSQPINENR